MKIARRQLRRIIQEAQWGRFTGGAAPLDEPPMDSGPMTPEDQQRVFDMLVDSGSDPKELKATGDYPDVDSMSSEVARRYLKRKYDWLEDTPQEEIHPLDVNRDGKLTIFEMKITRRQLKKIINEELVSLVEMQVGDDDDPSTLDADDLRATATELETGAQGEQASVIDRIQRVPGLTDTLERNRGNARGETMSGTWRSAAKYNQDSYDAIAQAFGVSNEEAYDVYMSYFRALRGRS